MRSGPALLDYAPPPKGVTLASVARALAILIVFALVGTGFGAAVGRFMFRPVYTSFGYLAVQFGSPPIYRHPWVVPQQWQLPSLVTTALRSARQVRPALQFLPSTPAEALARATLRVEPMTNLVSVSYTANDPSVAACMARGILDACIATPATYSSGDKFVAAIAVSPIPPIVPRSRFPLVGGSFGAAAGTLLGLAWVLVRKLRAASAAQAG